MAGEKDLVTEFQYTKELFEKIISPEKKFHTFPEGRHEPHADYESEEYLNVMFAWIKERLEVYSPGEQCSLTSIRSSGQTA